MMVFEASGSLSSHVLVSSFKNYLSGMFHLACVVRLLVCHREHCVFSTHRWMCSIMTISLS